MREALVNLNSDLVAQYADYVARVTADEGSIGRGHLSRFQDVDKNTPVVLTSSQLLTTGVDAPTCRNVILARIVGPMSEFKQIIGRGTRLRDDYGKLWFNILDYTTRVFADPAFDGEPTRITEEQITEDGETMTKTGDYTRGARASTAGRRADRNRAADRRASQILLRWRTGGSCCPPRA
jgi:type I restriction enzyme R subunit